MFQLVPWQQSTPTTVAQFTSNDALRRLRRLYRAAHHINNAIIDDTQVLAWAEEPNICTWATHQIRSRNQSYPAIEAAVENARFLRGLAQQAQLQTHVHPEPVTTADGIDPFDRLMPVG
jgi:hypothetical protein